ncbi:hypothetical protein pb186bvf_004714 [Paramecium bursaria]
MKFKVKKIQIKIENNEFINDYTLIDFENQGNMKIFLSHILSVHYKKRERQKQTNLLFINIGAENLFKLYFQDSFIIRLNSSSRQLTRQ